jgi:hypothetical protein
VCTVGDHAYSKGTAEEFRNWYTPTWAVTKREPGRHLGTMTVTRNMPRRTTLTSAPLPGGQAKATTVISSGMGIPRRSIAS